MSEESRRPSLPRKCQEEKKEEETVNMNKSKAEPVRSWCYPRQAGSIKMHRRVVWSLIFLVYGVCLVKAEVQEEQARRSKERTIGHVSVTFPLSHGEKARMSGNQGSTVGGGGRDEKQETGST